MKRLSTQFRLLFKDLLLITGHFISFLADTGHTHTPIIPLSQYNIVINIWLLPRNLLLIDIEHCIHLNLTILTKMSPPPPLPNQ